MNVSTLNLTRRIGWEIRVSTNDLDGGVLIYALHRIFQKCYFKKFRNAHEGKLWVDMLVTQTEIMLNDEEDPDYADA